MFYLRGKFQCILIFLFALLIFGCQREYYVTITNSSDPYHPHFCISSHENCEGYGIKLCNLSISQVNEKGNFLKDVWDLECLERTKIKNFIYGTPPEGFKETMPALPLELNKIYSVDGFYFMLNQKDGILELEMYNLKEAYRKGILKD